jgi:hypothetical protein
MYILVLNEKNIVPDGQNNKMIYRFPGSVNLKNKYIAVSSISMYYSWFNVTNTSQNNTLTYTWTAGAVTTTYTITIPDGLYEISAINNYCQFVMIQNATYWIDNTSGDYYYPFEILVNSNRYAIQLNTYLIPTSLPAGTSIPAGFPGWPTVTQNSVVIFPPLFNLIVGYEANFASNGNIGDAYVPPIPSTKSQNFVAKNGAGTLSYLSDRAPQVQPNNNVLFSISNINNDYAQPSSIIYSLNPNVGIGEQINERPPNFMWNKLIDGTYNELRLSFLGTDLKPLTINDPNMTILLTIRDKEESYIT